MDGALRRGMGKHIAEGAFDKCFLLFASRPGKNCAFGVLLSHAAAERAIHLKRSPRTRTTHRLLHENRREPLGGRIQRGEGLFQRRRAARG